MYIVQYSVAAILFRIVHIIATCGFDVADLITTCRNIKMQDLQDVRRLFKLEDDRV